MTDNELIEHFYVSQGGKPTSIKADIEFYSSSWDMLMPVVEKINGLREFGDLNAIPRRRMYGLSIFNPLPEVYEHVVEFIKWYNETTDQTVQ